MEAKLTNRPKNQLEEMPRSHHSLSLPPFDLRLVSAEKMLTRGRNCVREFKSSKTVAINKWTEKISPLAKFSS